MQLCWGQLRALRASSPARCCRFHQVNQNLVLVGTAAGEVVAFNVNIAKLTKVCIPVNTLLAYQDTGMLLYGCGLTALRDAKNVIGVCKCARKCDAHTAPGTGGTWDCLRAAY